MSDLAGRTITERMADAARELQDAHDPQHTLDAAVGLAVTNLKGCDAAGISMVHRGRRIDTPAATDDMVAVGDRLQYETGQGPCLDAIWTEQTVYSPSLAHDPRWPIWGPAVAEQTGARSVLAFRLFTHRNTLGALNLYSRSIDAFDEADRVDGLALAAHIAIAVAAARQIDNLTIAMDTRSVIGQAMGIVMERFDLPPDRAFAVLTRLAQTEEHKLGDIAAELVHTRLLPGQSVVPKPEAPRGPGSGHA